MSDYIVNTLIKYLPKKSELVYPALWAGVFGTTYLGLTTYNYFNTQPKPPEQTSNQSTNQISNQISDQSPILSSRENRIRLSSATMSMGHALATIGLSGYLLHQGPHLNWVNTPLQNTLLKLSVGYFVTDTGYILLKSWRKDKLFLIHHGLALALGLSSLHYNRGAYMMTSSIFFGEITNPPQIAWSTAREFNQPAIYHRLSPIYTYSFIAVRCLLAPPACYWFTKNYLLPQPDLPQPIKNLWLGSMTGLGIASFIWSSWLLKGYRKFLQRQQPTETTTNQPKINWTQALKTLSK